MYGVEEDEEGPGGWSESWDLGRTRHTLGGPGEGPKSSAQCDGKPWEVLSIWVALCRICFISNSKMKKGSGLNKIVSLCVTRIQLRASLRVAPHSCPRARLRCRQQDGGRDSDR